VRIILLIALSAALSIGCAPARLGPLDPQPKIKVDEQGARLALEIGEEVPDRFTLPAQGGVRKLRVKGWHETLTNAFENGLAKAYTLPPPEEEHDLLLVLVGADLQFLPTPGLATEGSTPAKAKLTYRIRILDAEGNGLAVAGGEVTSEGTWSATGEQDVVAEEVVVAMFKDIAYALVTKATPAAAPADEAPAALD